MIKESNDRIIRRIKSLLALAEGEGNVNESQSAFLHAQQMMIKYGVDPSEVTEDKQVQDILEKSGTDYKRLYWWERQLAHIVAKNFRCKWFYRKKRFKSKKQIQRKIVFMGTENDVCLANEMYKLVISAVCFYSNRYLKINNIGGNRSISSQAKNDYIRGFIEGLEAKFQEQINTNEWGLVLVIPKEVEDKYSEVVTGGTISFKLPSLNSDEHYKQGYEEGNAIDYTKSTINDEIKME